MTLTGQPEALARVLATKTRSRGHDLFICAEIGCNHQGSFALARDMIRIAAQIGCDAVKIQKRHPKIGLRKEAFAAPYQSKFGSTYGEHRLALELREHEVQRLIEYGHEVGTTVFASVWDIPSLEFMRRCEAPLLKIGAPCNDHGPLTRAAMASGLPTIISTGFTGPEGIDMANYPPANLPLFCHCTSSYPVNNAADLFLSTLDAYGYLGYSSHSGKPYDLVVAAALGAKYLECHFTLNKKLSGGDHMASLDGDELFHVVRYAPEAAAAMQTREPGILACEQKAHDKFQATQNPEA